MGCARVCTYTYIRDRWARLECSCTARVYILYAYYDDEVYGERGNVAGYAWYALCVLCICTCLCKWTPLAHTRTDWLSWKCSFGRPSMANRCESMTLRTHSTSPLPTRHTFDRHENARFEGASVVGARAGNQTGARASARGSLRHERKGRRVSSLCTLSYTQSKQREFSSTPRFHNRLQLTELSCTRTPMANGVNTIEALPTRPHQFHVCFLLALLSMCPRHEL